MTFNQLVKHFGSQADVARALKVSRAAVSLWKKDGIPEDRELEAEKLTDGILQASSAAKNKAARFAGYLQREAA